MRSLLFTAIFCVLGIHCFGQTNLVRGSKYVSLKYGVSRYSPLFVQGDFGWMYNEKMSLRFSGLYENGKVGSTLLQYSGGTCEQLFTIFTYKRVSGSLGAGAYGGYEWLKSERNPLKKSGWIYGALASGEVDIAVGDKGAIKVEFTQYYMKNSQLSPWFYTGTVGFCYIIN